MSKDDIKNLDKQGEKLASEISKLNHPDHDYLTQKIRGSIHNKNLSEHEIQMLGGVISALKKAGTDLSREDKIFADADLFMLVVDMAKGGEISHSKIEQRLGHLVSNVGVNTEAGKAISDLIKKDKAIT